MGFNVQSEEKQCEKNGTVGWGGKEEKKNNSFVQFLLKTKRLLCNAIYRKWAQEAIFFKKSPALSATAFTWLSTPTQTESLLNYWLMAICWVYELLPVHRNLKKKKGAKAKLYDFNGVKAEVFFFFFWFPVSFSRASSSVLVCDQ